jgi:hypothetical protein
MAATLSDITTGLQSVSSTGAVTGSLDISGMSGDFNVKVQIQALSAGKTVVIGIEDSVNAFTATVPQAVIQATGSLTSNYDRTYTFRKNQIPALRIGTGSAVVRLNVYSTTATPGLQVHAWIEQ